MEVYAATESLVPLWRRGLAEHFLRRCVLRNRKLHFADDGFQVSEGLGWHFVLQRHAYLLRCRAHGSHAVKMPVLPQIRLASSLNCKGLERQVCCGEVAGAGLGQQMCVRLGRLSVGLEIGSTCPYKVLLGA